MSRLNVLYHDDPDGWASGWLVSKFIQSRAFTDTYGTYDRINFIPVNYNDEDIMGYAKHAFVFMLDFSLQPYNRMKEFIKQTKYIIWIDHHKTVIEDFYNDPIDIGNSGEIYLKAGLGACAETCRVIKYKLKQNTTLPFWVKLIASYDVWQFPYGDLSLCLIAYMQHYANEFRHLDYYHWTRIETITEQNALSHEIIRDGCKMFRSWLKERISVLSNIAYFTKLFGYNCVCINQKGLNSLPFERHDKFKNADIWLTYWFNGDTWTVSLYSKEVDVSRIARTMGGGGHIHAAGFNCDTSTLVEFGIIK